MILLVVRKVDELIKDMVSYFNDAVIIMTEEACYEPPLTENTFYLKEHCDVLGINVKKMVDYHDFLKLITESEKTIVW